MSEQQQKWMESVLKGSPDTSGFPNFNRDYQMWESYLQQLSQLFNAYSVNVPEKQKAYFYHE